MRMYDTVCPECGEAFQTRPEYVYSETTENLHNGIYRDHLYLNCPKCGSKLKFYAHYELLYMRCESESLDGVKALETYSLDGEAGSWREPGE